MQGQHLVVLEPQVGRSPEEYGMEYRRVSGTYSILQFPAAMIPPPCRLFQFVAAPC